MEKWRSFFARRFTLSLWLVIGVSLLMALRRHYIMDDAYISFRYAHNLLSGNGLVWNIGERVEGYSNFLWVLITALGMRIGFPPELWTRILGIGLHLTAVYLTYRLGARLTGNKWWGLLAAGLTGINYTISGFATSGLETPSQLVLFLWTALLMSDKPPWSVSRYVWLAVCLNLSLLTRPDSFIPVIAALYVMYRVARPASAKEWTALLLPFAVIALPYGIWKISYYGSLFPNSYNAKVRGFDGLGYGLFYFYLWMIVTVTFPFVLMMFATGKRLWVENKPVGVLALFSLIWTGYVIGVGGDFMDFRFMVAITPFIYIVIVEIMRRWLTDKRLCVALAALLLLAAPNHIFSYGKVIHGYGIEKIDELSDHLIRPDQNWIGVGNRLRDLLKGTNVTLAVGPAGAIPYITELPCVDIMGLTDPEIPLISESFSVVAGHRIIAPLNYLYKRKVNLIVQPITLMIPRQEVASWEQNASWNDAYRFYLDLDKPVGGRVLNEVNLIAIPIDNEYSLIVWYLTPSPAVDKLIADNNLTRFKLVRL